VADEVRHPLYVLTRAESHVSNVHLTRRRVLLIWEHPPLLMGTQCRNGVPVPSEAEPPPKSARQPDVTTQGLRRPGSTALLCGVASPCKKRLCNSVPVPWDVAVHGANWEPTADAWTAFKRRLLNSMSDDSYTLCSYVSSTLHVFMSSSAAWTDAYLGVGANLGDRAAQIDRALVRLDAQAGLLVQRVSSAYESEAHRQPDQDQVPAFLNGVVHIRTTLAPTALLNVTQELERRAGRTASRPRWAPRPLDLDLLVVGSAVVSTERLTLPHPRLHERRFVLAPWAELAPNLWIPDPFDATVQHLLQACADTHVLRRHHAPLARSLSSA